MNEIKDAQRHFDCQRAIYPSVLTFNFLQQNGLKLCLPAHSTQAGNQL